MAKTAMQELIENLEKGLELIEDKTLFTYKATSDILIYAKSLLDLERNQIVEAYNRGFSITNYESDIAQTYYTETFGK